MKLPLVETIVCLNSIPVAATRLELTRA